MDNLNTLYRCWWPKDLKSAQKLISFLLLLGGTVNVFIHTHFLCQNGLKDINNKLFCCDLSVMSLSTAAAASTHTAQSTPINDTTDFLKPPPSALSVGPNWQHKVVWVTVVATETTQSLQLFLIRRRGRPRETGTPTLLKRPWRKTQPGCGRFNVWESGKIRDVNSWEEGRKSPIQFYDS